MKLQADKPHISAVFRQIQGEVPNVWLANRAEVHLNTVYNYQSDNPPVQLCKFIKLCDALGYEVHLVRKE